MKLSVQYMAQLRPLRGCQEEFVELPPGSNVNQLLVYLAEQQPDVASHLLTAAGEVRPSLLVAVNGAAVAPQDAPRVALAHGDVVTLLPPIAGG
jgi:molybdopterin synthase sulfur carrier subunit